MTHYETVSSEDEATHVRLPLKAVNGVLKLLGSRPYVEVARVIMDINQDCVLLRETAVGGPEPSAEVPSVGVPRDTP